MNQAQLDLLEACRQAIEDSELEPDQVLPVLQQLQAEQLE